MLLAAAALLVVASCAGEADDPAPLGSGGRSAGEEADQASGAGPRAQTDHWHAAYGIYVCDGFRPPLPRFDDPVGIHTHGDGLVHIHPFSDDAAGANATLGLFLRNAGVVLDDGVLVLDGERYESGDRCDGERAVVQVARWGDATAGGQPRIAVDGLADLRFEHDGEAFTIAFVPEGADIPPPPTADTIDEIAQAPVGGSASSVPAPDAAAEDVGDGIYPVVSVHELIRPTDGPDDPTAPCLEHGSVVTGADGTCYVLHLAAGLGTDVIESATVEPDSDAAPAHVAIVLTPPGLGRFNELAAICYDRTPGVCPAGQVAIVADGRVVSAPSVEQPTYERDGITIAGPFTADDLAAIADALDH